MFKDISGTYGKPKFKWGILATIPLSDSNSEQKKNCSSDLVWGDEALSFGPIADVTGIPTHRW